MPKRGCGWRLHRFEAFLSHEAPSSLRGRGCRGESGWCLDMTSVHGTWGQVGIRFSLSGVFPFVWFSCSCRPACVSIFVEP